MSEHKLPREPRSQPQSNAFTIQDAAVGKTVPIAEASDALLARAKADASTQLGQAAAHFNAMLNQVMSLAQAESALDYEINRRKTSITVVKTLNGLQG